MRQIQYIIIMQSFRNSKDKLGELFEPQINGRTLRPSKPPKKTVPI